MLIILLTKPHNMKVPSRPSKLPILGNLHQFDNFPHRSLWDLSIKYGYLMFIKISYLSIFVVSSAKTVKEIFKFYDLQTCNRHKLISNWKLSYNFLDIGLFSYSNYWKEIKKLVVLEIFIIKRVQTFRFIREDEVGLLLDIIS